MPCRLAGFACAGLLLAVALGAAPALGDGAPQTIEGEALAGRARATQGRVAAQDMRRFGDAWSGGAHLSWVPPTGGQQLYLLLPVDRAGEYDFDITYTRAANHGDFAVFVGGTQRGPTQGGFAAVPAPSGRIGLGRVALRAGANEVVITGAGKDARSQGFVVGIDRFDLTPVPTSGPDARPPLVRPSGAVFRPGERAPPKAVREPPADLDALLRPWTRAIAGWRGQARSVSPALEIEQRAAGGTEFPAVYGTDLLVDVDRGDSLERLFRWVHQLPGTVSAVWQAAAFEPAPMAKGWRTPAGLVAEGNVASLPGGSVPGTFAVDFAAFYTPPARKDAAGLPRAGSTLLRESATARPLVRPAVALPGKTSGGTRLGSVRLAPASALEPWFGSLERVFWVRVVCLDAQGEILAFPSNAVRVRFGPTPPVEIDVAGGGTPPAAPPWMEASRARVRILEYQPIRWEAADSHKRWVVSGPFPLGAWGSGQNAYPFGPVGAKLYISGEKEDEDLWETITGALGDLVTFFVDAVNWVSKAYESIKSGAIGAVAGLVPGCDATCRDLLAAGLDIGLAAVGLPPDVPDFDTLLALGKGHLADVLVEEGLAQGLPGVSEPLLREAANRLMDEVERRAQQTADRGPSGTAWLKPDPDFQYRPGYFRLEVFNPGKETLRPRLTVSVVGGTPWGWVFKQVNQNLPPVKPGERKEIPVFLEHDPWNWQAKDAREHGGVVSGSRARDAWWAAYGGPCRMLVSVTAEVANPADGTKSPATSSDGFEQPADQVYRAK